MKIITLVRVTLISEDQIDLFEQMLIKGINRITLTPKEDRCRTFVRKSISEMR